MKPYQYTMDDFLELGPKVDEGRIKDELALTIYQYLRTNHLGKDNAINGQDLAYKFGINDRALRKIISYINRVVENVVVQSGNVGYWAWDGTQADKSNMNFNRTINQLKEHINSEVRFNQAAAILFQIQKENGYKLDKRP